MERPEAAESPQLSEEERLGEPAGDEARPGWLLPALDANWTLAVLGVLLALFAVSVVQRLPLLDRPLADHHEFLTATALRVLQVWDEEGALTHRFLPVMTYGNPGDKHIGNQITQMDDEGKGYYTSLPPFGQIAAYLAIRAVGAHPSIRALEVFNMTVQLAVAFLLFLLVVELVRPRRPLEYLGPLAAYSLYVFSAITLWYHSNVYYEEMFVQLPWVAAVYCFFRLCRRPDSRLWTSLFGVSVFLAAWTEWLAFVFGAVLGVYALLNLRRPPMRRVAVVLAVASSLSLALLFAHYSLIDGPVAIASLLRSRFLGRMGAAATSTFSVGSKEGWKRVYLHYLDGYRLWLVGIVSMGTLAFALADRLGEAKRVLGRAARAALLVTLVPALLHNLLLFDFTACHEYAVLKSAVPLALLLGLFSAAVMREVRTPNGAAFAVAFLGVIVAAAALFSHWTYRFSASVTDMPLYREFGEYVRANARPDQMVFAFPATDQEVSPQAIVYARRNIAWWDSQEGGEAAMRENGVSEAIIFRLPMDPPRGFVVYRLGEGTVTAVP